MSLKRFAMLAAISYHNNNNQQNYNNNNNYNNNSSNNNNNSSNNNNNNNNNTQTITTAATQVATTFINTTTTTLEPTTKIINSNKSTLIQLKQQKQQQQQQQQQPQHIIAPKILSNIIATTSATTTTRSHNLYTDKIITQQRNDRQQYHDVASDDFASDITEDSSFYSSESNESFDQNSTPDHRPSNTYTSTTYYGSGFGVFHQQNIRSNGGGIALITGNGGSNGLGGSYSNGINNNVNLLLGGAMLTLITTILCVVCYCCHRNIKKRTEAAYRQQRQWLENDPNMEIYSVEQCYETSGLFVGDSMDGLATIPALHHEPPPSYDAVVAMQEQQQLLLQQQQLLMQQQLLQQQLPTNNSPPPGYRSSLDVSSMIQQGRGVLGIGGSIISGMEINSLASSTTNIRNASSHSPIDPLLNYNDHNGNMATALQPITTATPTNTRSSSAAANYMRNKQLQQQQRNLPATQLTQLNMKKVLQAQSCCSLQRAEVENMWNAAAAALAARSSHLTSESRASTTASTSSPTLAMNTRKLSQGYSSTSKSNTPETFGSRYLKQNYYRKGCPLCGKFRYDNDSTLSISMESNLDAIAAAVAEDPEANEQEKSDDLARAKDLNANNNNDNLENCEENSQNLLNNNEENVRDEEDFDDEELEENDNDVEQQCSCSNSKRKQDIKLKLKNHYQKVTTQLDKNETKEEQNNENPKLTTSPPAAPDTEAEQDANANCALETIERQSITPAASNNNNHDVSNLELPTTSANALSIPHTEVTAAVSCSSVSSASSTASTPINLDCINENGIISLDMSKIIDKTGLPTYDAALKLESSGYV